MKKKTKITFATVICIGAIATGAALGFQKLHIKPLEPQKSLTGVKTLYSKTLRLFTLREYTFIFAFSSFFLLIISRNLQPSKIKAF